MRRTLFDQNVPDPLRCLLPHDIRTAFEMGWSTLENGKLLAAAAGAGFAVFVTCDQSIRHQQNVAGLRLGLVVLTTNHLAWLSEYAGLIADAIERVEQGTCEVVTLPRPLKQDRSSDSSP